MQAQPGRLPTPFDRPQAAAEQIRCLLLRHFLIPQQIEHLLFFLGQFVNLFVEFGPGCQSTRFGRPIGLFVQWWSLTLIGFCRAIADVVTGFSLGPEVMTRQINQFPANLLRGQAQEMLRRLRLHGFQSPQQPNHGTLKHISRFHPTFQRGEALEHLVGMSLQLLTTMLHEQFARLRILVLHPLQELRQVCGGGWLIHTNPGMDESMVFMYRIP